VVARVHDHYGGRPPGLPLHEAVLNQRIEGFTAGTKVNNLESIAGLRGSQICTPRVSKQFLNSCSGPAQAVIRLHSDYT
jgi:hypothetical protein